MCVAEACWGWQGSCGSWTNGLTWRFLLTDEWWLQIWEEIVAGDVKLPVLFVRTEDELLFGLRRAIWWKPKKRKRKNPARRNQLKVTNWFQSNFPLQKSVKMMERNEVSCFFRWCSEILRGFEDAELKVAWFVSWLFSSDNNKWWDATSLNKNLGYKREISCLMGWWIEGFVLFTDETV